MSIYLIRHAQSVGNVNERTNSHATIPLTDIGHQQAQALLQQLPRAQRVLISSYLRTRQTAAPLLLRDDVEPEIYAIEEFSYLSDAKCKNTTLQQRQPWVSDYWQRADLYYRDADDAESFEMFYRRVDQFVYELKLLQQQYTTEHLHVFSHGQFLTLFKFIALENRELSQQLMHDFRERMLNDPIGNTEYFIYDQEI
ncbi:phosphoglycerate mutase family protein [Acinetobacter qingfengensis]|uniref:Alpha-ribazole phosphatase n=1 Tax=Acinetobacter qingfengensis TaxID=1262585 RepID=A0A1E7RCR4_9GAMM|nr:phosphoglycerate mutase family protein [Acinetobacter qingfengensis]KAA8734955.1 phosphoglycerate mutase family protein [Acinetobacter qingfengensis]OEY97042.1 alpha-ribazole phosphatase [Acinetobacter qingfengensis]